MDVFYTDYSERLGQQVAALQKTLAGLPDAALDWTPTPAMNSLAVLATHSAGATRYWIGDVVGDDRSDRIRASEFAAAGTSAEALSAQLAAMLAHSRQVLAVLTPADWLRVCQPPSHDRRVTVGWALLHALEHLAEHVGHAQITRELWEQQAD